MDHSTDIMEDTVVHSLKGSFRRTLQIGTLNIRLLNGDNEIFLIKWTQMERLEMDRKGLKKVLRFKCFNRTEEISTRNFRKKDLKEAYYHLVDLSSENGIKVIEVNGW